MLTKHLPEKYSRAVQFAANPTFERVAPLSGIGLKRASETRF